MIIAITKNRFFDESDGGEFMLYSKEGEVVGFNVQRFRVNRID